MTADMSEETSHPILVWRGILSRERIVALRRELLAALKQADRLTIRLVAVESFDISCLLLLCAAKRQAAARGQFLVLEGTESAAVMTTVRRYGYGEHRFCLAQCAGVCFWTQPEP